MRGRLLTAALAALVCLGPLVEAPGAMAASPPAAAAHLAVRVIGDCVHAQREPREVVITCADYGIRFEGLTYTSWRARSATGRGRLWINTCKPDCARGKFVHHPVRITMDRPVRVNHQLRFSRILVTFIHRHGPHRHLVEYVPTRPIP